MLRRDNVGLHNSFIGLGGFSLLLVKPQAALRAGFGHALWKVELFQWTTVAAQAARLTGAAPINGVELRRAQIRAARQTRA